MMVENYNARWEKRAALINYVGPRPRFNTGAGWNNDAQLALDREHHAAAVAAWEKRNAWATPKIERLTTKIAAMAPRVRRCYSGSDD